MVKLLHFLVFHFSPQKDRGKLLSGIHTKCFLSILIFYRSKQLKLSTPLLSSPLFSTIFARSKWTRVFGFSIRNPNPCWVQIKHDFEGKKRFLVICCENQLYLSTPIGLEATNTCFCDQNFTLNDYQERAFQFYP